MKNSLHFSNALPPRLSENPLLKLKTRVFLVKATTFTAFVHTTSMVKRCNARTLACRALLRTHPAFQLFECSSNMIGRPRAHGDAFRSLHSWTPQLNLDLKKWENEACKFKLPFYWSIFVAPVGTRLSLCERDLKIMPSR